MNHKFSIWLETCYFWYHWLMKLLEIKNPFNAPVYHEETVSSTFDAARLLAAQGAVHGTVIAADFQESGRGRQQRPWAAERGKNLLFTILLRYGNIPAIPLALTLRTGLAVSLAVEDLAPPLAGLIKVKWPNDLMIGSRKTAGILTEGDGSTVFIGVGVNVAQQEFPEEYRSRAISITQAAPDITADARFHLLEKILLRLYEAIEDKNVTLKWREHLTERLYKKGETVIFADGAADSDILIKGTLSGIGPEGELLIIPEGEEKELTFFTGELRVYA